MKLVSVQVKNFRCILDSNTVEIGRTTCLAGKNESGKTAFLKALEGLRSVTPEHTRYDKLENYPPDIWLITTADMRETKRK